MKPKISVFMLCATERTGWVNPSLVLSLLRLQQDERFELTIDALMDMKPVEHARNMALWSARESSADMCIQIDNDMTLPFSFGDIVHDAYSTGKAVVSLPSGILPGEGPQIIPGDNGPPDGQFRVTGHAGAGVLIINSEVWRVIQRGPWFRWVSRDDELLSRELSEDLYFIDLVQKHGLTVWTHQRVAGHLKTSNCTNWILKIRRLEKRLADLESQPGDARRIEHLNPSVFLQ